MAILATIPNVDIDSEGVFKYILIKASDKKSEKFLVRGYGRCHFHANILEEVTEKEGGGSLRFACVGGGRIKHEPKAKSIFVYGYSQGFGLADHAKSVELLKEHYPDYKIEWSNEGY
ncbi:14 kDa phosphohistidine phosphatase [Globodera pallida]|nr:14 kDa phosphohistidine phosphatase [Globodera pallida]